MSGSRLEASNTAPVLPKDVWAAKILPLLEVKDLYKLASASKEARQLVFGWLFASRYFGYLLNNKIQRLQNITEYRLPLFRPNNEFELSLLFGDTFGSATAKSAELLSAFMGLAVAESLLHEHGSNDVVFRKLFAIGCAVLGSRILHSVADSLNPDAAGEDYAETLRQARLRKELRGLVYLRDELPTLRFAEHRLFQPVQLAKPDAAAPAYHVDKGDAEPTFFRFKCFAKNFVEDAKEAYDVWSSGGRMRY